MKGAHLRAFAIGLLALILGALLVATATQERRRVSTLAGKPRTLLLLTSLPIIFDEDFSLSGAGSPVLNRLRKAYRVVPISVTSSSELPKGDILLMAHAPAQTAENLVSLDHWVRRGGRVMILADPLLEWPSKRPLGDRLRPSPMFTDTGLLLHWGLRLEPPGRLGEQVRKLGSYKIVTLSSGRLQGACEIGADGLDAHCRIGRGRAVVIADADFINAPALGPEAAHNLDALMEQLARLANG